MNGERRSDVILRRAEPDDAVAVGSIFDAAVSGTWTWLGDLAQEPMFGPDDWQRLVADHAPPNAMLVAEPRAGGPPVGFVAARTQEGELFLLFVAPAWAGAGVGTQLLQAAHTAFRSAGCRHAYLYVHERNARAIAVYRRAGYEPDGTHRDSDFRGIALRELKLVKPLP